MAETIDISQLAEYAEKTKKDIDKSVRATLIQVIANIIQRTPVDSGRLINNWYPSFQQASTETTKYKGSTGSAAVNRVKDLLPKDIQFEGKVFYLANNLPYARVAEYGLWPATSTTGKTSGGYSIKAPSGMVRVSITEANRAFDKAIKELIK